MSYDKRDYLSKRQIEDAQFQTAILFALLLLIPDMAILANWPMFVKGLTIYPFILLGVCELFVVGAVVNRIRYLGRLGKG